LLAEHPFAGHQTTSRDAHARYRLPLDRTPFVLFYTVDERRRTVTIVALLHEHHRRAG
jgi:hypothetical protein